MDQSTNSIIKQDIHYYVIERHRIGAQLILKEEARHIEVLERGSLIHYRFEILIQLHRLLLFDFLLT